MQDLPPHTVTPFVFSDPAGKRWPRLRLTLLIVGVLCFVATILFVQTLFVAPKMQVPFSLRQLKGQLKSLQKVNPAGQAVAATSLWQKFGAAKLAAKKLAGAAPTPTPAAKSRRKAPPNEVRMAYYANNDSYSYLSLQEHASLITHLCPEWMSVINGMGDIQIDADNRLPEICCEQRHRVDAAANESSGRRLAARSDRKSCAWINRPSGQLYSRRCWPHYATQRRPGWWWTGSKSIRPTKRIITGMIDRFCDALHDDDKELWLWFSRGRISTTSISTS